MSGALRELVMDHDLSLCHREALERNGQAPSGGGGTLERKKGAVSGTDENFPSPLAWMIIDG
jgi:hypothetical protein